MRISWTKKPGDVASKGGRNPMVKMTIPSPKLGNGAWRSWMNHSQNSIEKHMKNGWSGWSLNWVYHMMFGKSVFIHGVPQPVLYNQIMPFRSLTHVSATSHQIILAIGIPSKCVSSGKMMILCSVSFFLAIVRYTHLMLDQATNVEFCRCQAQQMTLARYELSRAEPKESWWGTYWKIRWARCHNWFAIILSCTTAIYIYINIYIYNTLYMVSNMLYTVK